MPEFLGVDLTPCHQAFQSHLPSPTFGVPLLSRGLSFAHFHHPYLRLFSCFAYSYGIRTGVYEEPKPSPFVLFNPRPRRRDITVSKLHPHTKSLHLSTSAPPPLRVSNNSHLFTAPSVQINNPSLAKCQPG